MKVIETTCEIFQTRVIYIRGCSAKEAEEYWKATYGQEITLGGACVVGTVVETFGLTSLFLIWIKKQRDILTLIHELIHLVNKIFVYKGVPFNSRNDETIAYYLEYWFAKLTGHKSSTREVPEKLIKRRKRK